MPGTDRDRRYRYLPLSTGKPFGRYGIEQQGDIVQDYFMLLRGCAVPGGAVLEDYRDLLPFTRLEPGLCEPDSPAVAPMA